MKCSKNKRNRKVELKSDPVPGMRIHLDSNTNVSEEDLTQRGDNLGTVLRSKSNWTLVGEC